jgi:hypothetical protein
MQELLLRHGAQESLNTQKTTHYITTQMLFKQVQSSPKTIQYVTVRLAFEVLKSPKAEKEIDLFLCSRIGFDSVSRSKSNTTQLVIQRIL